MKTIAKCLTLALLVLACGTRGDDFRWGDSNKNNKMKYNNSYAYLSSSNGRAYLYLGEAKIVNDQVSLEGLTYICDATAKSSSDSSFGNHYSSEALLSNDLISDEGGQVFSLIVVSLNKPTSVKAGSAIEPGDYYSVAIKTGTSVASEDAKGKYASLVISTVFANGDYSMPGSFVKAVEPVSDGGYMWGSSVAGSYRVPKYSDGTSTFLSSSTALTYLYLGKAEYKNGVINLGNLTHLATSTPQTSGSFGNYTSSPTAAKLIQDDRVDPNGGQNFTILIVTPDSRNKMPPNTLVGGYTANYIAIQTGTSTSAVTSDGAKHAQMVTGTATVVKDFFWTVPLVDVGGSTFGVY